jgi:hypothetical protein
MPKVLFINGFSFFFYSNEGNEPPHIHVSKGDGEAKFWLVPLIELDDSEDFTVSELRFIREVLEQQQAVLLEKWNEYFGQ